MSSPTKIIAISDTRLVRVSLVGVSALGLAVSLIGLSPAPTALAYSYHQPCPAPQPIVKDIKWSQHKLAPGVTLREGSADDKTVYGGPGSVNLHVLRVSMSARNIHFSPIYDSIAKRAPLSQIASGRKHLVAATNTGFFDFNRQAPRGPVFANNHPVSLGRTPTRVVGFTQQHRVGSAMVGLDGAATIAGTRLQLSGWNYLSPGHGLAVYTDSWGNVQDVPMPDGHKTTVLRDVIDGEISGKALSGYQVPPAGGDVLVASTKSTEDFLRSAKSGDPVTLTDHIATHSGAKLVEGYGVGIQLVQKAGQVRTRLGCNELNSQAARTAVGYSKDGKTLIIAIAADNPNEHFEKGKRELHGLDHKEMSKVMVDLGAARAWEWDGSGSSELVARLPKTHRLTVRNYCADGDERPMPLGFGVFTSKF